MKRGLWLVGWVLAWLVALGCAAWAFGALHYDFLVAGSAVAWTFALAVVARSDFPPRRRDEARCGVCRLRPRAAWWLTLKPTNEADWQPDVAQLGWAEINGDEVTLHDVRNCKYRTETDFTPRWETRTVRVSQITGIDMAINYWGSPWMAHPILSFQFADAPTICFSISRPCSRRLGAFCYPKGSALKNSRNRRPFWPMRRATRSRSRSSICACRG